MQPSAGTFQTGSDRPNRVVISSALYSETWFTRTRAFTWIVSPRTYRSTDGLDRANWTGAHLTRGEGTSDAHEHCAIASAVPLSLRSRRWESLRILDTHLATTDACLPRPAPGLPSDLPHPQAQCSAARSDVHSRDDSGSHESRTPPRGS